MTASEPSSSGPDGEAILSRAEGLSLAHRTLHEAAERRDAGPEAREAWSEAALRLREAQQLMYPDAFWADVHRLAAGDARAIEPALVFLEADPWCFRSGYVKEKLAHLLRRHELTDSQRERLVDVLLRVVDRGDRLEYRTVCKLASRHATPRLRPELKLRLVGADAGAARRALLMLTTMSRPRLDHAELAHARQVILEGATRPERDVPWWTPDWVVSLARRFWSEEWEKSLKQVAFEEGKDREAALHLLASAARWELTPSERARLTQLVIDDVDTDIDTVVGCVAERFASAIDSPALRAALLERAASRDEGVRRRAQVATNVLDAEAARRTDP